MYKEKRENIKDKTQLESDISINYLINQLINKRI